MNPLMCFLAAIAALVLASPQAFAQSQIDPVAPCANARAQWAQIAPSRDAAAYNAFLPRIPNLCRGLQGEVRNALAVLNRSAGAAPGVVSAAPRAGAILPLDCAFCPELAVIPAGAFQMGGTQDSETPVRAVAVRKRFAMAVRETTVDQWSACVNEGSCRAPASAGAGGDPVTGVSYDEARAYAQWLAQTTGLKYRLPTEAEWEYAARAGDRAQAPSNLCAVAHIGTCGASGVAATGGLRANAWGLRDMLGNVTEWVFDCYNPNFTGAPRDQSAWVTGACAQRVVRGGSWFDGPQQARYAARDAQPPGQRGPTIGFRVVRDMD